MVSEEERVARRRAAHAQIVRRRRLLAGGVAVLLAGGTATLALGVGGGGGTGSPRGDGARARAKVPPKPAELPLGGRTIFPRFRIVGYYGTPQDARLGALGVGNPSTAVARLRRQAAPYARPTRPVLLMLELISSVATRAPGPDGRYRSYTSDAVIRRYLRAARRAKGLLVLDIQPGRADFFSEARRLERWLREPDVGLALDPEWHMAEGQIPGKVIGSVEATEVNATSAWLSQLVVRNHLPEKLFLVHQFTPQMIMNKALVKSPPGLAIVFNVDGFGTQANKLSKWRLFTGQPPRYHDGYKLFYREDVARMTPRQVMRMRPRPDLIDYQ